MDAKKYPFLTEMKKRRDEKELDELQEQMITMFSLYGLQTDEVASLLFSTMKIILSQKANKAMLRENFRIEIDKLGPEGILTVQQALLESYVIKNKDNWKVD